MAAVTVQSLNKLPILVTSEQHGQLVDDEPMTRVINLAWTPFGVV
jgi:hypothetical protein